MEHEKSMDYNFLKKQLINLFASNQALPGLAKYDVNTLVPLPFDGVSVIHMTPEQDLIRIKNQIKDELKKNKIANKIALVDSNSFHITTFDLMNRFDHKKTLRENEYKYEEVFNKLIKETYLFINSKKMPINTNIEISGIAIYRGVIILNPVIKPSLMNAFIIFRDELHQHLTRKVKGYSFVRKPNWQAKFNPHITLGYIINPMNQTEINDFINLIKKINKDFKKIKLEITEGDIVSFSDMNTYNKHITTK